jgi:glycosyltransferase involved in cell wall biosynthesis
LKPRARVIAFITSYFPEVGGAEVALRQVAQRLSGEFEFVIVTARRHRDRPAEETAGEGRVWRLGIGSPLDKWCLPAMAPQLKRRLIGEQGAAAQAILWAVDITQAALLASLVGREDPRFPLILSIQYGEGPARLASGRLGLIRLSFRHLLRQAHHVTAVSTSLLQAARHHGYSGAVSLIPNGVDLDLFRRPDSLPTPPRPTILTVSRLVDKNGIDTLIRAMPMLVRDFPSIECRVIGDGPLRQNLERLAADLGVAESVRFFGSLRHEETARHLWESDVFVRPSRSEGLGNAFLEALAAGVPVVGTRVGGIPDFLLEGKTGLFARVDDPADLARQVGTLLGNRELATQLSAQGMALVRARYDADAIAGMYAAVFRETLAR